ncbi:MAG: helix-turn-helix transcriptional regulator [Ktedonobacteraceae bacterium]
MQANTYAERAAKRRFAILTMLHNRPHAYDEIITNLSQMHLIDFDPLIDSAVAKQQKYLFRHDRAALQAMDCQIEYDRRSKSYAWRNSPFGLHLDASQLAIFSLLCDTFADATILHADEIHNLLTYLVSLLPTDQQAQLKRLRRPFSIDLHETTDYRKADPATVAKIEMAIQSGRQLEFHHRAAHDGKERRHVIEPRPLVYERGHVYLSGWSIDWDKELRFRLDYIIPGSVTVLSKTIASTRPLRAPKQLRYRLNAVIARNSVSEHFSRQVVESHPDGSATVTAQITDIFEARRTLLSYGMNCTVLEPPELVAEMRTHTLELYKIYHTPAQ